MGQLEFQDREKTTRYVSEFLQDRFSGKLEVETCDSLARELITLWREPDPSAVRPPGARGAHVAAFRWVIRDDDLKVVDSILDGLKASAGAGFFVVAGVVGTAITA